MEKNYQIFAVPQHSGEWTHQVWLMVGQTVHSFFAKEYSGRMSLDLRLFRSGSPYRTTDSYHGDLIIPCQRIYTERRFFIFSFGRVFSRKNPNGNWEVSSERKWHNATLDASPISTTLTIEEYLSLPWEMVESEISSSPKEDPPQPISCWRKNIKPQNFENFSRVYVAFLYFLEGASLREGFLSK